MAMALDSGPMNTMKALSALNIRLTALNELLETEQYDKIIELFEEALKERIKQWKLKQLTRFRDKDQVEMRTIHEAYQYLFKRFVDDAAKNTIENKRATLRLTIKEINSKFSELTEDDIKKYSDMKKLRKSEETMIMLQNVPKKSLAKKAKKILAKTLSETRLKVVKFDDNSSSEDEDLPPKKNTEDNLEEDFDIQNDNDEEDTMNLYIIDQAKKSSSKRHSKEKLEISPRLTEYDKVEGVAFVESRRGSMDKSKVTPGVGGKTINPLKGDEIKKVTIAKKSMAKMASKTRKKSKSKSKEKIPKATEDNPLEDFPLDHEFESSTSGGFNPDELSKKLHNMLGNVSLNENEDQVPTTPMPVKRSGFERR